MIFVSVRDASAWDFPPDSVWCLVGGWFELESSWRFEGFLLLKCQLVFLRFICDVVCFRVIPVICSFCCWGRLLLGTVAFCSCYFTFRVPEFCSCSLQAFAIAVCDVLLSQALKAH